MPRQARKPSVTGIHHIWIRGINQQRLFEEDTDYEQFLSILAEAKELSGFELFAYCLMDNHLHLLIRESKEPLGQVFQRIGIRYVQWFNWKYQRSGHLFQDRFMSKPVDSDSYFITVLAYIYNNPVAAGLCAKSTDYRWSSRRLLGHGGIIDESGLYEIIPRQEIEELEEIWGEETILGTNRKPMRLTDQAVAKKMSTLFAIKSTAELQSLDRDTQARFFMELRKQGVSVRQFARLAGIGRRVVERMAKRR
ncbi:MAG: transposase [Coriobacteriales bacterium]|nr:transposase [Coriobacteriales bacterium]